jgi:hypothetical protein
MTKKVKAFRVAGILAMAASSCAFAAEPASKSAAKAPPKIVGTKTVTTAPLTFEGLYGGTKTVATAPLGFEGLFGGTKTVATTPLAFEGLHGGTVTVKTSGLAFEGSDAPKPPPKGGKK